MPDDKMRLAFNFYRRSPHHLTATAHKGIVHSEISPNFRYVNRLELTRFGEPR
jgi:hypothetical protein